VAVLGQRRTELFPVASAPDESRTCTVHLGPTCTKFVFFGKGSSTDVGRRREGRIAMVI
jgi:hypothetical protein